MSMKFQSAVNEYLRYAQNARGSSSATQQAQKSDLQILQEWMQSNRKDLETLSKSDLQQFADSLTPTYAPASAARIISTLHSFFDFLSLRYDLSDPALTLKAPKQARKLPSWITKEELTRLMQSFPEDDRGLLEGSIILTLFCTGLRVSELCSLASRDVRLDARQIRVLGKGQKERIVPLPSECVSLLEKYARSIRSRFGMPRLFFVNLQGKPVNRQFVYRLIKKKALETQLPLSMSPHTLRHSYATSLLESQTDLRVIQELLGHSDISTTQIYTHVDKERMMRAYDQAMPDPFEAALNAAEDKKEKEDSQ